MERTEHDKPFNLWLRDEIGARGQTQRDFAQLIDIDESNISNYITGKRIPNTRVLLKIIMGLHEQGTQKELVELLFRALVAIENISIKQD